MKETKEERAERQARELWRFIQVLAAAGNVVEEEVRFHDERRWRFDLALPQESPPLAIEIEGFGRHQSMGGFVKDIEKYGEAFALGWNVLRVTRAMIADGTALDVLARRGVRVEANDRGKTFVADGECPHTSGQTTEGNCARCGAVR